jgi:hypothetical protein
MKSGDVVKKDSEKSKKIADETCERPSKFIKENNRSYSN